MHKLSICLKELKESRAWLRSIVKHDLLPQKKMADIINESDQLCRIIAKSILTARDNDQAS